jgi:Domain of unknown function (DUF4150)
MSNEVYANGNEISCKAADGKSMACMPDVCMTPPENPATPPGVPVPYPNNGMPSDTSDGSRTVLITSKEAMLKNLSFFKKSSGNEAGSATKKGVVTGVNTGKVYFAAWSMDVKIEGENVVRHLDLTTHNHGSSAMNAATMVYRDRSTRVPPPEDCKNAEAAQQKAQRSLPPAKRTQDSRVTAGAYSSESGTSMMAASNVSRSAIKRSPGRFEGFSGGIGIDDTSNVECGGAPHEYQYTPASSKCGHAEAKIIEDLFSRNPPPAAGSTLYMKVVGRPVCCNCQKLISCASDTIKIVICPPASQLECEE